MGSHVCSLDSIQGNSWRLLGAQTLCTGSQISTLGQIPGKYVDERDMCKYSMLIFNSLLFYHLRELITSVCLAQ